jgi:hypothetical protein
MHSEISKVKIPAKKGKKEKRLKKIKGMKRGGMKK